MTPSPPPPPVTLWLSHALHTGARSTSHTKHTAHKEDFRKGIFFTLQRNSLPQPLHVCSKFHQSDHFFWSSYESGPIRLFVLIIFVAFRVTQACLVNKRYVSVWSTYVSTGQIEQQEICPPWFRTRVRATGVRARASSRAEKPMFFTTGVEPMLYAVFREQIHQYDIVVTGSEETNCAMTHEWI